MQKKKYKYKLMCIHIEYKVKTRIRTPFWLRGFLMGNVCMADLLIPDKFSNSPDIFANFGHSENFKKIALKLRQVWLNVRYYKS
ncbi:hypothetical protein OUZ56_026326 [Daphnia magna]|uniref:Uncharacterized protein n=1 Tax=Daphnia magna TaxID=35525 RepID=A0ABQ9ZLK3_9CRUS|nr:hypothetical protein OUZ56_026326 [Daphnia magna]